MLKILSTVNSFTNFLEPFEHFHNKRVKSEPSAEVYLAIIIAYGCNIGTKKIARISNLINEKEIDYANTWYFSPENVDAACDKILEKMFQLDLPNVFILNKKKPRTTSDGQKYRVNKESLIAEYSFKYFGQAKGVTAYSLSDEAHRVFGSTVFSSGEREAPYVVDGLMNNKVVKSSIHSTDTHGYTEIVFGLTHLLGFEFQPRIKKFQKQVLYSFKMPKEYKKEGYEVLPGKRVNTENIKAHWEDILRVVATIKLKINTSSQIFKRLSSYSRQHPLYRAIKSFGQIMKSIFILRYIDNNLELRQTIEKQLNKIEAIHRFAKAIFFGNNQEFNYSTHEELLIAEGCKRLIENAIICWNYLYLSYAYSNLQSEEAKQDFILTVKNGSIVIWHHINLYGEYDFSEEKNKDSIGFDFESLLNLKAA